MSASSQPISSPTTPAASAPPIAGATAIVIGSGITGLATALRAVAERGLTVTLLERDAEPATDTASEAFTRWQRKGASQVRHSHVFLGRLRNLLRDRHPELLAELLAAGARELKMLERAAADDARPDARARRRGPGRSSAAGARRSSGWSAATSSRAAACPLLGGATVTACSARPARSAARDRRARSARARRARELHADLVVDASGRQSQVTKWLAALGARPPHEVSSSRRASSTTRASTGSVRAPSEPPARQQPRRRRLQLDQVRDLPGRRPHLLDHARGAARLPRDEDPGAARGVRGHRTLAARGRALDRSGARRADRRSGAPGAGDGRADQPPAPLRRRAAVRSRSGCSCSATPRTAPTRSTVAAARRASCTPTCSAEALDAQPAATSRAVALDVDQGARRDIEPFYRASVVADRDAVRKAEGRAPRRPARAPGCAHVLRGRRRRRDALRSRRLPRLRAHDEHARDAGAGVRPAARSCGARCACGCAASGATRRTRCRRRPIARR